MAFLDYHTHRASELEAQIERLERERARLKEALSAAPAAASAERSPEAGPACAHCASPIRQGARVCPTCKLVQPHAVREVAEIERKIVALLKR